MTPEQKRYLKETLEAKLARALYRVEEIKIMLDGIDNFLIHEESMEYDDGKWRCSQIFKFRGGRPQ